MALDDSSIARPSVADSTISNNGGYDLAAELGLSPAEVTELSAMPGRPSSLVNTYWNGTGATIDLVGQADAEGRLGSGRVMKVYPDRDNSTAWAVPHLDQYGRGRS